MLTRAREFLLGGYHDLPNVLFIGSLILGTLTGYLPLIWMSIGLILNAMIVATGQTLLSFFLPQWSQVSMPSGSAACEILTRGHVTNVAWNRLDYNCAQLLVKRSCIFCCV